ncbi:hypothetical protein [Aquibium microcysteis]|uniref:hypothetical protein n=1 Tax=Aquibium microcysteis TaxID=675281 RepID=UPI00165D0B84|nr:hypothetical protein [Aquibium microcysteis]
MTPPTLDALFPPGTFLAPRREDDGPAWAPVEPHMTEFMTANLVACAGGLPMLVQKAAMSPTGLAAMERCGVRVGSAIEVYGSPDDYRRAVGRRQRRGETAAYVHGPAGGPTQEGPTLVAPELLAFLNDKRNVAQLAGPENVPARRLVDLTDPVARAGLRRPIVLKVATGGPSAGGTDVAICRSRRHLRRGLSRFAGAEAAIAESLVDAAQNWCLQYAVMADGTVLDIGASEQICLRNGVHAGNLLDGDVSPPPAATALGRAIAAKGSQLGFRGICGFDILVDRGGKPFAIDLNFRPVSSTAFVHEMLRRKEHPGAERIARLAFCRANTSLATMMERCEPGLRDGWLVPLATFDPEHGGLGPGPARLRVAIMAADRRTLHGREASLAACGIEFFRTPARLDGFLARLRALF